MTSKNMTPRKVVALASDTSDLYAVADDGTVWFIKGIQWHPLASLPPREDEGEGLLSSDVLRQTEEELRIAHNAIAQLGAKNERILSDLRRVREAVREYISIGSLALPSADAIKQLETIDKEPMP